MKEIPMVGVLKVVRPQETCNKADDQVQWASGKGQVKRDRGQDTAGHCCQEIVSLNYLPASNGCCVETRGRRWHQRRIIPPVLLCTMPEGKVGVIGRTGSTRLCT